MDFNTISAVLSHQFSQPDWVPLVAVVGCLVLSVGLSLWMVRKWRRP
jgi:hypothetical protein